MSRMNIFQVIRQATSTIERIHSEYLAAVLRASYDGDRELFTQFWQLAVDSDENWPVPTAAEIKTETFLNPGRVDITVFDRNSRRCLGVEVKTTEASTTDGQLATYQSGLEALYRKEYKRKIEVRMAYLTPFNHEHSPERATHSRREFCAFKREHSEAVHLSWLDVACIEPHVEDDLWSQHQEYVREEMCAPRSPLSKEMREFGSFFDADVMENFWTQLEASGVGIKGEQTPFDEISDINQLISALKLLINSPEANSTIPRGNKVSDDLKRKRTQSIHGPKHDALFAIADKYPWVWIEGKGNYGVRVAHHKHPSSGVSLCTVSENGVRIVQKRPARSNAQLS